LSVRSVGQLQSRTGLVAITRSGSIAQPPTADALYPGDLVETAIDGSVTISLCDGTLLHLFAGARMAVGGWQKPSSLVVRMLSGQFEFIKGKSPAGNRLTLDTPFGEVRSRTPGFGAGSVALGVFTFAFLPEAKADSADIAFLDNGVIDYKDLKHGVYEIVTKGINPQHIVVDDPTRTVILTARGSSITITEVTNSPVRMAQLQNAYSDAYANYTQGLNDPFFQQWQHAFAQPQSGPSGSGDPGSILALNGNNNGGPGFLFVPTLLSNSNDLGGGSGGTGSGTPIVIIPPPPVQPQQLTLTVGGGTTVNGGTLLVQTTDATHVLFSITGLTADDNGTLIFSDGTHTLTLAVINGQAVDGSNTPTTVNLSSFKDDATITSSLSLSDPAGNTFSASGNTVTLDQDATEQAGLSVSVNGGTALIQTSTASAVAFSISGLASDDSGTLTFSDGLGDTVTVTITNGVVVAGANNTPTTVNLSSFKDDATITSSLSCVLGSLLQD
jgi:hypothetical protein